MAKASEIKVGAATLSYGTDALVAQTSSRVPVRLVKEVGYAMLRGNIRTLLDGDTAETIRVAQIEMGCLNNGLKLTQELESESKPLSCTTSGSKTLYKSAKWTGSIETMQIDPVLMAMWTGLTLKDISASVPGVLWEEEILTASSSVITLTYEPLTIIEVKRTSDGELYHESDTAAAPTATTSGAFELDATAKTLTFATGDADSEFVVKYRRETVTPSEGLVLEGSLASFPSTFAGWMSFLAVAPDNNTVGRIVATWQEATITSNFELGGAGIRENLSKSIEFEIQDSPKFTFEEFA